MTILLVHFYIFHSLSSSDISIKVLATYFYCAGRRFRVSGGAWGAPGAHLVAPEVMMRVPAFFCQSSSSFSGDAPCRVDATSIRMYVNIIVARVAPFNAK